MAVKIPYKPRIDSLTVVDSCLRRWGKNYGPCLDLGFSLMPNTDYSVGMAIEGHPEIVSAVFRTNKRGSNIYCKDLDAAKRFGLTHSPRHPAAIPQNSIRHVLWCSLSELGPAKNGRKSTNKKAAPSTRKGKTTKRKRRRKIPQST